MQLTASVFRAIAGMSTDTVNYCYTKVSCYGAKIPALTGELLMTKELCCKGVTGASWGGKDNKCESCAPQASNDTKLPREASGKYNSRTARCIATRVFEFGHIVSLFNKETFN